MDKIINWIKKTITINIIISFLCGCVFALWGSYFLLKPEPEVKIIVIRVPTMDDEIEFMGTVSKLLRIMMNEVDKIERHNKKVKPLQRPIIVHPTKTTEE